VQQFIELTGNNQTEYNEKYERKFKKMN